MAKGNPFAKGKGGKGAKETRDGKKPWPPVDDGPAFKKGGKVKKK